MKKILLLLLAAFTFSGCEKDDICTDETTPQLVIEFYDVSNPTTLKNVAGLKITGDGMPTELNTFSGVSTIKLPLDVTGDSVKYSMILNSSSPTNANEDFLQFNYARNNVYVSRACGYRTIFELNSPGGVIHTDSATPDLLWIQSFDVQTTTIDTENEIHLKIYF
ncbi:DUF6452 family protein [Flavobacterium sedimenticola]|uniref:DUF6452 family protein n=1 Tax=Flavobacterium sedimenticola TaxID=3043286 RepID=A0ABT6XU28_9FLAO|nr:DUF6452 family protein [Flavobacterium sedimenticola]MDI9258495.1 DUF6452 family protein [Flavobacterium sedimenticola]